MIKLYIYRLFNLLSKSASNLEIQSSNLVEKSIIKEINYLANYKSKLRRLLGYTIKNEKYKPKDISIKTKNSYAYVNVSAIHSFYYINDKHKIKSSEKLHFILICKKVNRSWFVIDMCNKDIFPNVYKKLSELKSFDKMDKPLDLEYRLKFFGEQLSSLNHFSIKFKKLLRTSKYPLSFRHNKYNAKLASKYAQKYALTYNSKYKNFDSSGGDCTNFISQCINAGNIPTNTKWKPYSNSWVRVNELYYYLIENGLGVDVTSTNTYKEGDIIQFYNKEKGYFSHSGIITHNLGHGEYLYCCHSYDKLNFPLSEVFPFMYDKIRVVQLL